MPAVLSRICRDDQPDGRCGLRVIPTRARGRRLPASHGRQARRIGTGQTGRSIVPDIIGFGGPPRKLVRDAYKNLILHRAPVFLKTKKGSDGESGPAPIASRLRSQEPVPVQQKHQDHLDEGTPRGVALGAGKEEGLGLPLAWAGLRDRLAWPFPRRPCLCPARPTAALAARRGYSVTSVFQAGGWRWPGRR